MIEVTRWQRDARPATPSALTADARSLRVRSGSGGISPLGDEEKAAIAQTIDEEVLKGGTIAFRSSRVTARDGGYDVAGRARPARRHPPARVRARRATAATSPAAPRSSRPTGGSSPTRRCSGPSRSPTSSRSRSTRRSRGAPDRWLNSTTPSATGKPRRLQLGRDPRPRPDHPVRRGRQGARARDRRAGQGRDQGQDGRDVDDVQRHGRGRRARRGRAHARVLQVKSKDTGGSGLRERRRRVRARRRRRRRSTPRRRSPARPRRWARASSPAVLDALIKDFTHEAGGDLSAMTERMVMRRIRAGRGAAGRRHRAPGGPRPSGLPRQRPVRLRLRRVRQRARRRRWAWSTMNKRVRIKCGRCRTINVAACDCDRRERASTRGRRAPFGFGCCGARRTRGSSAARAATSTTSSCPGCCTARSCARPVAHARIVSIDTSAALQHPRVHAVITGADSGARDGLDADDVGRRAGRAGDGQGALPGPGGGVRRRRRPLLGARRARADRRRVRAARRRSSTRAARWSPTRR